MTDWRTWHEPYADPGSPLSHRLRLVQQAIADWLDQRTDPHLVAVSACAGQGHDLLGVLANRPDRDRVRATLLEWDEWNLAAARTTADDEELTGITFLQADAGDIAAYTDTVPADLVLLAGVLGNVSDADVRRTVGALPQLCAPGATVIWTRSRRPPDLTPDIRRWLAASGFEEQAFHAPQDVQFSVGVHRLAGLPQPLPAAGRLFSFAL